MFRSLSQEDPLEEEIGTNSSILAWKIPCTEELGGLQSPGSHIIRHDLSDLTLTRVHKEKASCSVHINVY